MTASPKSALVLVSYYLDDAREAEALVDRYEDQTGLRHDVIVLVENRLPLPPAAGSRDVRQVTGDNSAWEFSGMVAGLEACEAINPDVCTVLNDSYGRNWEISAASRPILREMSNCARLGGVAAWQDVFAWFPFQQRANSRLLIMGGAAMRAVRESMHAAIERERRLTESGLPLFSPADAATLDRWEAKNPGRWSPSDLVRRRRRIFLEHTMLDAVPDDSLRFFPSGPLSAVSYTLRRKLEGERR